MPDEPTTLDLVEIVRRANDAFNRRDVDAWLSFLSPDIVYRPNRAEVLKAAGLEG